MRHVRTDPVCRRHRPPRSRLGRWWFDRHRGQVCPVCARVLALEAWQRSSGEFTEAVAEARDAWQARVQSDQSDTLYPHEGEEPGMADRRWMSFEEAAEAVPSERAEGERRARENGGVGRAPAPRVYLTDDGDVVPSRQEWRGAVEPEDLPNLRRSKVG